MRDWFFIICRALFLLSLPFGEGLREGRCWLTQTLACKERPSPNLSPEGRGKEHQPRWYFLAARRWGFGVVAAALAARLLTGCASPTPSVLPTPTLAPATLTATLPPTSTTTLVPTAASTSTPTPPPPSACSPLEGITLAELGAPDLLKNPFLTPRPGFDDGHHGADFAYWSRGDRTTMLGHPVLAVLGGTVAGVVHNRTPYGYAVIIETPLNALPPGWVDALPAPAPTAAPADNISCPAAPAESAPTSETRSLYLLYAHMDEQPLVAPGETAACGQQLGVVGTTGRSVNYHLHLETRVGPAGARFETLAHYDNAATNSEMGAYCAWRVSGLYQMVDPMGLLSLQP